MLVPQKSSIPDGLPVSILVMSSLSDRIRQAREHGGFESQASLARAIGVSKGAVNFWETGDTKNLKLENLEKVARVCNVDLGWLVSGNGAMEGLSKRHRELIKKYDTLDDRQRQALWAVADLASEYGDNGDSEASGQ
jgi:transcriptional regulator with XRE-family HTH domain